ncbi:hypothetical protein AB0M10_30825 [Streptomyces sp. NPDC051840]|uniref:hypothetical protein n=1 Tax=unclassified Streptomyces TaxID=2593676 RepID=UPI00342C4E8A
MINQLSRYYRHMTMLIVLGALLVLVSQMGAGSTGFLLAGIFFALLGAVLIVVTVLGRRRQRT